MLSAERMATIHKQPSLSCFISAEAHYPQEMPSPQDRLRSAELENGSI
jgi:hypothetical protein